MVIKRKSKTKRKEKQKKSVTNAPKTDYTKHGDNVVVVEFAEFEENNIKALPKKVKKRRGVISKYETNPVMYNKLAYVFGLLGLTVLEMADVLETTDFTITKWNQKYPEFRKALQKGRKIADANVAASLYRRALGYNYTESRVIKNNKGGEEVATLTKHALPSVTAQIFWLTNRTKQQDNPWVDVKHQKHDITARTMNMHLTGLDLSEFTTEELQIIRQAGVKVTQQRELKENEELANALYD